MQRKGAASGFTFAFALGGFVMRRDSDVASFQVNLTPQPDPPNVQPIYAAIGRILVSWGLLENQIDFGLLSLMRLPQAAPVRPKLKSGEPIPTAFKQKVDLWRKAFRTVPAIAKQREEALAVIDEAVALVKRRDAIVHGNWNKFEPGDPPLLIGVHFRLKGNRVFMVKHTATEMGFDEIASAIRKLSRRMVHLLADLHPVLTNGGGGESPG